MALSIYTSLRGDGREFRLLILEPSTDRFAPVRCKLKRACFDDGNLKYTALSYAWGDPLATTPIVVNGIEARVTFNLEAALRHIRKPSCAVVLWIDALCINQEDVAEKNRQVEMMRDIYSSAELVIAWLGSASEDSDLVMKILGKGFKGWKASARSQRKLVAEDELHITSSSIISDKQAHGTSARGHSADFTTPSTRGAASNPVVTNSNHQRSTPIALFNYGASGRRLPDVDNDHQDEYGITDQSDLSASGQSSSDSSDSELDDRQFYWKNFTRKTPQLTHREILAIPKFFKRSWWSRIWVVQEVMLAKKVIFKCGEADVPGERMSSWGIGPLSILHARMLHEDDDLSGRTLPAFNLLEALRNPINENSGAVDYLLLFGMRGTIRPHDHIYGLLGIIPEKDRLLFGAPDYGCRAEDLFVTVATKLMVENNSLELLLAAGMPTPLAESSTELDLPSWVPDWTRPWLTLKESKYSRSKAGFISEPVFRISEDMKELVVEGLEFDKIESVKFVPKSAQGEMPIWQDDLVTEERTKGDRGLPPIQRQIAALFLDVTDSERLDNEGGFELVSSFFQELKDYRSSLSRCETSGDYDDLDYLAGFLHWTGETRNGRTDEEILKKVFSVEAARSFVAWYHKQSSEDLQRMYMQYTVLRNGVFGTAGYSMFRTCKGSFGVTWAAAAAEDILCMVPSCGVPLVLRRVQSPRYRLVGPSSPIAGTLGREIIQAVERGDVTRRLVTLI